MQQEQVITTDYKEPEKPPRCKDLMEVLSGAVDLCGRCMNGARNTAYEACASMGGKIKLTSNKLEFPPGDYKECNLRKEYFESRKTVAPDLKKLMHAMILLSLATGHPEAAIVLSKKMLMMNALGGHDFAF